MLASVVQPRSQRFRDPIGPSPAPPPVSSRVRLSVLRTAMSGYARVYTGRRSLGGILLDRAMRLFRTEFWW